MNVTCSECRSVFRVDPTKVPAGGVRARCAVCGGVIAVEPPAPVSPIATPAAGTPRSTAAFAWPSATPPATPGVRTDPGSAAAPAAPAAAGISAAAPAVAAPPSPTPATPAAAIPPTIPASPDVPPSPFAAPSLAGTPAYGTATRSDGGTPAAGMRRSGAMGRSINPFLSNDPDQKAKRLARALVSDIVAYHPQLRDQGLREGTLKQLFRDEIKKSYEEYVDQVGKEFAESTAHFQDALNDILAAGRKVF